VRPGHDLPVSPGHPSTGPIKPPGAPILPPSPDNGLPPNGHPWLPGHWRPVDPGYGLPPVFAFFPVDPGWGAGAVPPPTPGNELPGDGHWVPVDPDYGKPERPCGGKPSRAIWAWIPHVDAQFPPLPPATATPK
jgi:hypothetical protein